MSASRGPGRSGWGPQQRRIPADAVEWLAPCPGPGLLGDRSWGVGACARSAADRGRERRAATDQPRRAMLGGDVADAAGERFHLSRPRTSAGARYPSRRRAFGCGVGGPPPQLEARDEKRHVGESGARGSDERSRGRLARLNAARGVTPRLEARRNRDSQGTERHPTSSAALAIAGPASVRRAARGGNRPLGTSSTNGSRRSRAPGGDEASASSPDGYFRSHGTRDRGRLLVVVGPQLGVGQQKRPPFGSNRGGGRPSSKRRPGRPNAWSADAAEKRSGARWVAHCCAVGRNSTVAYRARARVPRMRLTRRRAGNGQFSRS